MQLRGAAGHHHVKALLIQARNCIQAAGDGPPLRRRLDVGRAIVIDNTVAVEDDQFHIVLRRQFRQVDHAIGESGYFTQ